MKKILLALAMIGACIFANAQCTTTNATSCQCKDPNQTDCDLLPDIEIGHPPFYDLGAQFGVIEYSQTGNGVDDGRLKVTVSTPNTGHGPLEIRTTNIFVCGTDTFVGSAPAICPDGISYPKILVTQRIYHKANGTMTFYDRAAGTMTYHPSHGHMHVDNWGNYTLRTQDTLEPNPLNWPIIGAGTKLAFCVEDYTDCPSQLGHCLDSAGNSLNNSTDFPNYGLGGGGYFCSPAVQGISSGYVDIYWTSLDGMWLDIPPGTCNGDYYIVCEVDPNHNFLEEDETNNVFAVPFTLTKQFANSVTGGFNVSVSNGGTDLCPGESVTLQSQLSFPNLTYHWSNGDTTASTVVQSAGTYTVDVTNNCGTQTSAPVTLNMFTPTTPPVGINDTIPTPGSAIIGVTSAYPVTWYDQPVGGTALLTGNTYITPSINVSTTYYAEAVETHPGAIFSTGLADSIVGGSGGYLNSDRWLNFDCINPFTLHTVKIYSQNASTFNVLLRDNGSNILQTRSVSVTAGMNIVTLDFNITPGTAYQLARDGGDLFRNNSGANIGYPITVPNYCSITGTSVDGTYYYYFYDWDIRLADHTCSSTRTPVEAVVRTPNAIAEVSVLNSLKVYPNPAKGTVHVSFNAIDETSVIEFVDALGRIVLSKNVRSNGGFTNESFDVSNLSHGVYSIHILSSGKNFYHRLVIE